MSGRGDNNKNGTSGQGSSNQSNQGFSPDQQVKKSNHGERTGTQRSEPQAPERDASSDRNGGSERSDARRS